MTTTTALIAVPPPKDPARAATQRLPAVVAQASALPLRHPAQRPYQKDGVWRVHCPYCYNLAVWRPGSAHLYRGRDYGPVYECAPCKAWVGVHNQPPWKDPLGIPANAALRNARRRAHRDFDRLWLHKAEIADCSRAQARKAAYAWLADAMGIQDINDCHIAYFNLNQCEAVRALCRPWLEGIRQRSRNRYIARRKSFLEKLSAQAEKEKQSLYPSRAA